MPPPLVWVKINFDVTIRNSFSIATTVCRNDLGDVIFAHSSLMPPSDPLISEVTVVPLALNLTTHHNLTFVLFEGKSKSVIENLQSPPPIIPKFLLNEMHIVSFSLKSILTWEFCFISRNLTCFSHNLAC